MAYQRGKNIDLIIKHRGKWAKAKVKQQEILIATQDNFRQNGIFTDVELQCNGGTIKAHKLILCAASSYFNAMFNANMTENISGQVDFKNYSLHSMEVVTQFLYTGVINHHVINNRDVLKEVLKLSHLMNIEMLFSYCWDTYVKTMNVDNFVEVWNMAEIYEEKNTREFVIEFAIENFKEIYDCQSGIHLTVSQIKELVGLLIRSHRVIDDIVMFILKWGKSENERVVAVTEILHIIDFGKISNTSLHDLIEYEKYLTESENLIKLFHDESSSRLLKQDTNISCFNQEVDVHFYFRTQSKGDLIHTYSLKEKKWHFPKPLPEFGEEYVMNKPLSSEEFMTNFVMFCLDDWFYFASECDDKIIKYNPSTDYTDIIYPNHKVNCLASNRLRVVYQKDIFVWDSAEFKKFNTLTEKWQKLTHFQGKYNECNLIATKQAIYLWNRFKKELYLYDVKKNSWKCHVQIENTYILNNCLNCTACKGKLWFLDRTTIVMYDPINDAWNQKSYIKLKDLRHIPLHCDQPFLLFCERKDKTNFWLFDPLLGQWEDVVNGLGFPNWFACAINDH